MRFSWVSRCGATYTHVEAGGGKGGSGTSGMLNHIANKHPEIYTSMMQANPHLTKSPKIRKPEGDFSDGFFGVIFYFNCAPLESMGPRGQSIATFLSF